MNRHRFQNQFVDRLPLSAPRDSQFVVCPMVLCQGMSHQQCLFQQQLYQWAYEQARAAVRQPLSLYEVAFSLN